MNTPKLILVVAASADQQIIGKSDNELPWPRIPKDMKHFRDLTIGYPVIMGRVTFETLPPENGMPKPLSKRLNIVVTRKKKYVTAAEVWVASSIEDAITKASLRNPDKIFIIGGQQIYEATIHLADEIYFTEVRLPVEGTTRFPPIPENFYVEDHNESIEDVKFPDGEIRPIPINIQRLVQRN